MARSYRGPEPARIHCATIGAQRRASGLGIAGAMKETEMKKSEIRNAVLDGKVTLGMLRQAFTKAPVCPSWARSTVNKGLTKEQAIDILKKAIEADTRPDETVMNGRRDVLTATNVIREVGFSAMLP